MKQRVAVVLLTIGLGCACRGQDVAIPPAAKTALSRNPYPNELPGFKFYAKYLAQLRPYVSGRTLVVHVLGSDQGIELRRWRIRPLFEDITGRLASVSIRPKQRVSMQDMKFPAAFTHSLGGVSEVNVTCDVYSDSFGLQYWLVAEDSTVGRKGDLMEIVYGPSRRILGHPNHR